MSSYPEPEALRKVAQGLGLIYAGLCTMILAVIVGVVAVAVAATAVAQAPPGAGGEARSFALALAIPALMMLAGIALDLAGRLLCLSIPPQTGAAGYLYVSVGIVVLNLIFALASLGSAFGILAPLPRAVGVITNVLGLLASVLFMIVLRMLAEYIGSRKLADQARSVLQWAIIVGVAYPVCIVLTLIVPLFGILALAVGIAALVVLIRYANLLTYLRRAILNFIAQQPGPEAEARY